MTQGKMSNHYENTFQYKALMKQSIVPLVTKPW